MMWGRKRRAKIKELRKIEEEASRQLHGQKPHVNAVSNWLAKRQEQNGFGMDFEYTLRPRGTR